MIHKFSKTSWYSISTVVRQDFPKKITVTDVNWDGWRLGVGNFFDYSVQFFNSLPQVTRIMPYLEQYQVGITYEIESTQIELERQDLTVFDWISDVGGLGFLFSAATLFVGWLNSPQMWITSAMLASGKEHTVSPYPELAYNS